MTTIKDVAREARVSTATVSAVVNHTSFVSPELRARVETAILKLGYQPLNAARALRRGRSDLIAICVADLSNPFYGRIVCAAEAAVSSQGFSLVVFNSNESAAMEQTLMSRLRAVGCDGVILVPVGAESAYTNGELAAHPPKVLLGRSVDAAPVDSVTIDNVAAGRQAGSYLLDLGHRRIGSITGPLHLSTARGRLAGLRDAMGERGVIPLESDIRSGAFREEIAYSIALDLLRTPDRPTALYVANGVMALGVMRALADLGLRCPEDISIASTDTIAGYGGVRPRLTRCEHPINEMTSEAVRLLMERIDGTAPARRRNIVFTPTLVVGDSCAPVKR